MNNVRWLLSSGTMIQGKTYDYNQLMAATNDAAELRAKTGADYRVHALITSKDGKTHAIV